MAENNRKGRVARQEPSKVASHRPIEFGGPLGDLVKVYKTAEALAEAIGTSPRSLRRWAQGKGLPSLPAGKMLVMIAAQNGITEEQMRPVLEGRGSVYPAKFRGLM